MTRPGTEDEIKFWTEAIAHPDSYTKHILNVHERQGSVPNVVRMIVDLYVPNVLDMGCGPISALQGLEDKAKIKLTRVDPLALEYKKILENQGISLPPPQEGSGETYTTQDRFDIIFMRNCLDHSENPELCVRNLAGFLKDGGHFIIISKIREGTNASWGGFHQWDLGIDGNTGKIWSQDHSGTMTPIIPGYLKFMPEFYSLEGDWFSSVYKKEPYGA